jgi:hypothetical protein
MPNPSKQIVAIVVLGIAVAVAGFQTGRRTVNAAAIAASLRIDSEKISAAVSPSHKSLPPPEQTQIILRDIATVPFSELYDVLRSASRDQLLAWARDLERMPRGPRQRAAVTAYYKSLIQVDHHVAIEAVLRAENLNMRDVAIDALTKAAPESIWGDLAEMLEELPHPRRGAFREDVIWNWSRVDPVAVSKFIERHPVAGEDYRLPSILSNWGRIDPTAARDWIEADPSRQTKEGFSAFVNGWAGVDRAAATDYAVANAYRTNFAEALNDLAYYFIRKFPEDATTLILRLPKAQAQEAMKAISHNTTVVMLHVSPDYQKPPALVAPWMVSMPLELWNGSIGNVVGAWMDENAEAATVWVNQLRAEKRDAVIADLCRTSSTESVERTITLGLTINDPKLRDEALGDFARGLGQTLAEAIEAVNELPITEEQKSYLRKVMPEVGIER